MGLGHFSWFFTVISGIRKRALKLGLTLPLNLPISSLFTSPRQTFARKSDPMSGSFDQIQLFPEKPTKILGNSDLSNELRSFQEFGQPTRQLVTESKLLDGNPVCVPTFV